MFMEKMLLTSPVVSLYEGEGGDAGGLAAAAAAAAAAANLSGGGDAAAAAAAAAVTAAAKIASGDPNAPVAGDPAARFNQDQLNKIVQDRLAKDRKQNTAKYHVLETSYQELLANQSLGDEERGKLEGQLEDLRKQHRTKEEQAKHDRLALQDQFEVQLTESKKQAAHWENEYRTSTITRSLMDAAVTHDAFMAEQVVTILRDHTKLVEPVDENGKALKGAPLAAMVDLPDTDVDTGKPIVTQRTPAEAVKRLKELQPNLFKANVVSGVGGNSSTGGVTPGADGKLDASRLTTEQFMEIYKKDPTKLGLRSGRRHV
jgi:hypothetical protein